MAIFTRLATAVALVAALAGPAFAAELTPDQQAGLDARIASFDAAMRESDMAGILGVIPPAVLTQIATNYGVTSEDLVTSAQQQIDEALKSISIVSFGMDSSGAEAVEIGDGSIYVMIPTETVMDLGQAGKMRSASETLALLDDGTWYLMAVDDPAQIAVLRQVYPAFADVEFTAATMEVVPAEGAAPEATTPEAVSP
jgi:hypothetical protein